MMTENGWLRIVFPRDGNKLYVPAITIGKNKVQRWLRYGKQIPIPEEYKIKVCLRRRLFSKLMGVPCSKFILDESVPELEKWLFIDLPTPMALRLLGYDDVFTAKDFVKRLL